MKINKHLEYVDDVLHINFSTQNTLLTDKVYRIHQIGTVLQQMEPELTIQVMNFLETHYRELLDFNFTITDHVAKTRVRDMVSDHLQHQLRGSKRRYYWMGFMNKPYFPLVGGDLTYSNADNLFTYIQRIGIDGETVERKMEYIEIEQLIREG